MATANDKSLTDAADELSYRQVQREAGDGAGGHQEAYIDENSIQDNDGRSDTVTGFDSSRPMDANGRPVYNPTVRRNGRTYQWWEYLNQLNDGVQDSNRASANWKAGKINDAELFCDHLGFNRDQTEDVVRMAEEMDFRRFGKFTTGQILVSCCSLVADADTEVFEDRIIVTDSFKELMEVTNLGSREHRKIRKGIRQRTEFF